MYAVSSNPSWPWGRQRMIIGILVVTEAGPVADYIPALFEALTPVVN